MAAQLCHNLLNKLGHRIGSEVEDIAVGLGIVFGRLLRRCRVEVVDVRPNVVGEVDVDVVDDLFGGARNVDLAGATWDVELPGQVDNVVHDHLALSIGSKEGVVVEEDGSVVGDGLIRAFVSIYALIVCFECPRPV